jgi:hypothetical protein
MTNKDFIELITEIAKVQAELAVDSGDLNLFQQARGAKKLVDTVLLNLERKTV